MDRSEVVLQRIEDWSSATARAVSGCPSLNYRSNLIRFDGRVLPTIAPYLHLDLSSEDHRLLRGVGDAVGLRVSLSDPMLYHHYQPSQAVQRLVYELLEQLRVESLAPSQLPGIRLNLSRRFLHWANHAASSPLVESESGLVIFTVLVMAWSRILIHPIPANLEEVIEATRWGLADSIGGKLRELKARRENQEAYAEIALEIAEKLATELDGAGVERTGGEAALEEGFDLIRLLEIGEETSQAAQNTQSIGVSDATADDSTVTLDQFSYQVFNAELDQIKHISELIRQPQLRDYRQQLDQAQQEQSINVPRLARSLQKAINQPQIGGWRFGQEDGYLDASRLAQLVTGPDQKDVFKQEAQQAKSDCVVTILVDNSGSMTHHNILVATLVDTLARAAEMAGAKTELLGYTTREWNGGQMLKQWKRAGSPKLPGRLCSLQHTIYKDADTPWRRARAAICGMLRTDLFRESCDGEALEWATQRLQQRPESKKVLLVIADGSPMESATLAANGEDYLDRHLVDVATNLHQRPDLGICALGVGLNLSRYYQNSLELETHRELTTLEYLEIVDLIKQVIPLEERTR